MLYFSAATAYQVQQILGNENLSEEERTRALLQCLQNAVLTGGLYVGGKAAARQQQKNQNKAIELAKEGEVWSESPKQLFAKMQEELKGLDPKAQEQQAEIVLNELTDRLLQDLQSKPKS